MTFQAHANSDGRVGNVSNRTSSILQSGEDRVIHQVIVGLDGHVDSVHQPGHHQTQPDQTVQARKILVEYVGYSMDSAGVRIV